MIKIALVLCAALLALLGCKDVSERPLVDGYTLEGVVVEDGTGAPVSGATVLLGLEPRLEFHAFAVTDANGGFVFKPAPNTAPHDEVFRFQKTGYLSLDIAARTASRVGEYRYRLEAHLESEPPATAGEIRHRARHAQRAMAS